MCPERLRCRLRNPVRQRRHTGGVVVRRRSAQCWLAYRDRARRPRPAPDRRGQRRGHTAGPAPAAPAAQRRRSSSCASARSTRSIQARASPAHPPPRQPLRRQHSGTVTRPAPPPTSNRGRWLRSHPPTSVNATKRSPHGQQLQQRSRRSCHQRGVHGSSLVPGSGRGIPARLRSRPTSRPQPACVELTNGPLAGTCVGSQPSGRTWQFAKR